MPSATSATFRKGIERLRRAAGLAAHAPASLAGSGVVTTTRRGLADLLFPPSCVSCTAELDDSTRANRDVQLCDTCFDALEIFAGPVCAQCGAPVASFKAAEGGAIAEVPPRSTCYHCTGRKYWFDQTIALGAYDGTLRDIVLRMKRVEGDALSLTLARLLVDARAEQLKAVGADVVAPIPAHWRRRVVHRTNSAAILAEVLASRLQLPLAERLLRRSRYTVRQSDLSPTNRWSNVKRAFAVRGGYHLNDAHVLLVDDVLTTGATCSEAAKALRKAGAESVTVAVIARATG